MNALIIFAVKKLISRETAILGTETEQDIFFSVHHIFFRKRDLNHLPSYSVTQSPWRTCLHTEVTFENIYICLAGYSVIDAFPVSFSVSILLFLFYLLIPFFFCLFSFSSAGLEKQQVSHDLSM